MNLISIIVPIYNSEKYLDKCVNSIINQTYKNLEIILINDGSIDNSLNIIKKYQKNDKRIKVYDKKNTGVSDTRNFGIKKATGKYLMFIDSDDYIDYDYVDKMQKKMMKNNSDIVISGLKMVNEKGKILSEVLYSKEIKKLEIKEIITDIINTINFNSCAKTLYLTNLVKKNSFNSDLKYSEDLLFSYKILKSAKNIIYYPIIGYNYLQNEKSLVHNFNLEKLKKFAEDNYYTLSIIKNDYKNKNIEIENRIFNKINFCIKELTYLYNYNDFKNYIKIFLKYINFDRVDIKKINYGGKLDRYGMKLLINKHYYLYYILNKIDLKLKRR